MTEARRKRGLYWDKAWSLVSGCTPVSPGCQNCWAAKMAAARAKHPNGKIAARNAGLVNNAGQFNGCIRFNRDLLDVPAKTKKPTVFSVWTDLFHDKITGEFITEAIQAATAAPQHKFLFLTKREINLPLYFWCCNGNKAENLWFGVTAENQEQADKRIRYLQNTDVKNKFISFEPLIGPVEADLTGIDWVICGGESGGAKARPCNPEWVRSIRDQCAAAGIPFFFKNWGHQKKGRLIDGKEHLELPEGF